jgi:hypothetical protein
MSPLKGRPTKNIQMLLSRRRFVGRFRQGLPRIFGGAASSAPTGYCYGKARLGVESGSELPHSTESRRGSVWSATACRRFRGDIRDKGESDMPVGLARQLLSLDGRPSEKLPHKSSGLLSVAARFNGYYDFSLGVAGCEITESFRDGA